MAGRHPDCASFDGDRQRRCERGRNVVGERHHTRGVGATYEPGAVGDRKERPDPQLFELEVDLAGAARRYATRENDALVKRP